MSDNYVDGDIDTGSYLLSITPPGGGSAVDVICKNVQLNLPSKTIESTDENDLPRAQKSYDGFVTGTGTAIIVNDNHLSRYATFSEDLGYGSQEWYIDSVSPTAPAEGERTQSFTFRLKIN